MEPRCLIPVATVFLLLAACQSRDVCITDAANHSTVTVPMGHALRISLASNPTTGYRWHVGSDGAPALRFLDSDYESNANPWRMAGVGGTETLSFIPCRPGTGTIALVHAREWPKAAPSRADFEIVVVVPEPAKEEKTP